MLQLEPITFLQKLRGWLARRKRHAKSCLLFVHDTLYHLFLSSPGRRELNKKRVVFVRSDAIGDFVLWTSALSDLVSIYPKDQFTWVLVCNAVCSELAASLGTFDQIIPVYCNRFSRLRSLAYRQLILRQMRELISDIVVNPVYSREFAVGDSLVRAISSASKVGSEGDLSNSSAWQRKLSDRWYTRILRVTRDLPKNPTMELDRCAEFVTLLGGKPVQAKKPDFRKLAAEIGNRFADNQPFFVVFPGAGWPSREWSFKNFLQVAEEIQKTYGWLCVFCGSEEEKRKFSPQIEVSGLNKLNLMGQTTLPELIGVFGSAELIIANETSGAHIGAACRVPTVCITGGGHYRRFVPWSANGTVSPEITSVAFEMPCFNCNWKCIYKVRKDEATPCVSNIQAEQVIQAVHQICQKP